MCAFFFFALQHLTQGQKSTKLNRWSLCMGLTWNCKSDFCVKSLRRYVSRCPHKGRSPRMCFCVFVPAEENAAASTDVAEKPWYKTALASDCDLTCTAVCIHLVCTCWPHDYNISQVFFPPVLSPISPLNSTTWRDTSFELVWSAITSAVCAFQASYRSLHEVTTPWSSFVHEVHVGSFSQRGGKDVN